jgi:hypothetical protein
VLGAARRLLVRLALLAALVLGLRGLLLLWLAARGVLWLTTRGMLGLSALLLRLAARSLGLLLLLWLATLLLRFATLLWLARRSRSLVRAGRALGSWGVVLLVVLLVTLLLIVVFSVLSDRAHHLGHIASGGLLRLRLSLILVVLILLVLLIIVVLLAVRTAASKERAAERLESLAVVLVVLVALLFIRSRLEVAREVHAAVAAALDAEHGGHVPAKHQLQRHLVGGLGAQGAQHGVDLLVLDGSGLGVQHVCILVSVALRVDHGGLQKSMHPSNERLTSEWRRFASSALTLTRLST